MNRDRYTFGAVLRCMDFNANIEVLASEEVRPISLIGH